MAAILDFCILSRYEQFVIEFFHLAQAPVTAKPPQIPRTASQESKSSPSRDNSLTRFGRPERSYSKQEEYEGGKSAGDVAPAPVQRTSSDFQKRLEEIRATAAKYEDPKPKEEPPTTKHSPEEKQLSEPIPQFRSQTLRQLSQEMDQESEHESLRQVQESPQKVPSRPESRAGQVLESPTIREQFRFMPESQPSQEQPTYADLIPRPVEPQGFETQPQYVGEQPASGQFYEAQPQYVGTPQNQYYEAQQPTAQYYESQPQYDPNPAQPQQEQVQYRYEPDYQVGSSYFQI